jgi:membrane associated rhomboid family serine protease
MMRDESDKKRERADLSEMSLLQESDEERLWQHELEEQRFEREWQMRRKRKGPLARLPRVSSLWPALWLYCCFWLVSLYGWSHDKGHDFAGELGAVFQKKEVYRLFSALFMHADVPHLLSNGWLFLIFGWFLRESYGLKVFPVLSLVMGAVTNAWALQLHGPRVHLYGASGMIYAMIAFWLVCYLRYDVTHTMVWRLVRAIAFVLVILVPSELRPSTSYYAHAAGFVVGLVFAAVLLPFSIVEPSPGRSDPSVL